MWHPAHVSQLAEDGSSNLLKRAGSNPVEGTMDDFDRAVSFLERCVYPEGTSELVRLAENEGIGAYDLKCALWHLIGRKQLRITRDGGVIRIDR